MIPRSDIISQTSLPIALEIRPIVCCRSGASEVVCALVADPRSKHKLTCELLRHGDIERALVEWRSLLRHIVVAPGYPLSRWTELKAAAEELVEKTASPTSAVDLATLVPLQQRAARK